MVVIDLEKKLHRITLNRGKVQFSQDHNPSGEFGLLLNGGNPLTNRSVYFSEYDIA